MKALEELQNSEADFINHLLGSRNYNVIINEIVINHSNILGKLNNPCLIKYQLISVTLFMQSIV